MEIPGIQSDSNYQNRTDEPKSPTKLSADDFLKLFMTQLTHQNPMQPTDSSAILRQMAEISTIESSASMQQTMNNLAKHVDNSLVKTQLLQATSLVGKQVQIESDVSPLRKIGVDKDGNDIETLDGSIGVPAGSSNITVTISDPTGKTVLKTIKLGNSTKEGLKEFNWDGKDETGKLMSTDYYKITATATINGKTEPLHTAGSFQVKSVGLGPQGVVYNVDGLGGVTSDDIIKIL